MNKINRVGAVRSRPSGSLPAGGPSTGAVERDATLVSARGRRWLRDNEAAIDCYNQWIADNGLPLEVFRPF